MIAHAATPMVAMIRIKIAIASMVAVLTVEIRTGPFRATSPITVIRAAGYEPLDHASFLRTADASQLIMSIAQTNTAMATVLRRKFVVLRIAFLMAGLDLMLIVGHVLGLRF